MRSCEAECEKSTMAGKEKTTNLLSGQHGKGEPIRPGNMDTGQRETCSNIIDADSVGWGHINTSPLNSC